MSNKLNNAQEIMAGALRVFDEQDPLVQQQLREIDTEMKEQNGRVLIMTNTFNLDKTQQTKLNDWIAKQNTLAIEEQKLRPPDVPHNLLESFWKDGFPYGGAIGGDLTYQFTPTSLGVTVVVKNVHTKNTIDLTDYESW